VNHRRLNAAGSRILFEIPNAKSKETHFIGPLDSFPGDLTLFAMDPLVLVVLKVVGVSAGFLVFWYLLYRFVLDTRKRAGRVGIGGQLMATALSLFPGSALDPAREVTAAAQKLKRNQDGSGDPESDSEP
jgi:hypothetical protein